MRNLRNLLVLFVVYFSLTSFTVANDPTGVSTSDLRERVLELVEHPTWEVSEDDKVTVEFQLDAFGDFKVIHVYSDKSDVVDFVKERLNDESSDMMLYIPDQSYFIDISFLKES